MDLLIENQTSEQINVREELTKTIKEVLQTEGLDLNYEISVTFVDKDKIRSLNREYRNVDRQTDVLSFPMNDDSDIEGMPKMLGDIVICMDVAKEQAENLGHTLKRELMYLTAHSTLHLLGYDHLNDEDKKVMRTREKEVMRNLKVFRDDKSLEDIDLTGEKNKKKTNLTDEDIKYLKDEIKKELREEIRNSQLDDKEKIYNKENLSHGQKFLKGFDYAYDGLVYAINHEKNMKFHLLACIIVLIASLFFNLSRLDMMFLIFAISSVITLELINTALENAVDIAADGRWLILAKAAKDISAAATFVSALNAMFIAYLVFFDKFLNFYDSVILRIAKRPSHLALISVSLVIIVTIFLKGVFYEGKGTAFKGGFVSGHTSVSFCLATIGILLIDNPLARLILFGLALIVAESRYEANIHSTKEIIRGALLGISVASLIFGVFS